MLMLKDAAHEKSTTVKKKRRAIKKEYEKLVVSSPTPTIEHLQILRDLSSAPFLTLPPRIFRQMAAGT